MWIESKTEIVRTFEFDSFVDAFGFMTKVAMLAEKMNHHPTWTNTYNRVEIRLSTHDEGNLVTQKDWTLARAIDLLV